MTNDEYPITYDRLDGPGSIAATRGFDVSGGTAFTVYLSCEGGDVMNGPLADHASLQAVFAPD